jgi:copper(I)-binding protein
MNKWFHRRSVLHAGLALATSLLAPRVRACEYFGLNLRVTHPWTRATAPGASSAVLCMKFDEVTRTDRLVDVQTPVAERAEMGGVAPAPTVNFLIPQGQESLLSEEGSFVRLVGLKLPMEVGRSYPLKLVFESGSVINATLNVDYARFL